MNIQYYPSSDVFDITQSSIKPLEFPKALTSYIEGNTLKMKKSSSYASPLTGIDVGGEEYTVNVRTGDELGHKCIEVGYVESDGTVKNGRLTYHKSNFNDFVNGAIRFTVRKLTCKYDYGFQRYRSFITLPAGNYSILMHTYTVTSQVPTNIVINLNTSSSIFSVSELADKLNEALVAGGRSSEIKFVSIGEDLEVRTRCENLASGIKVYSDDEFFNEFFDDGPDKASYFSSPEYDTAILSLSNDEDDKNAIKIVHSQDGKLYLTMYDETGKYKLYKPLCDWTWTNEEFVQFELDFGDNGIFLFFANGKLQKADNLIGVNVDNPAQIENITRQNPSTYLYLVGKYNNGIRDNYARQVLKGFDTPFEPGSYLFNIYVQFTDERREAFNYVFQTETEISDIDTLVTNLNNAVASSTLKFKFTKVGENGLEVRAPGSVTTTNIKSIFISKSQVSFSADFYSYSKAEDGYSYNKYKENDIFNTRFSAILDPEYYTHEEIGGDPYAFSEVAIFNERQNLQDYVPGKVTDYDGSYYVVYNYGQMTAYDNKKLSISGTGRTEQDFLLEMKDGTQVMVDSTIEPGSTEQDIFANFKKKVEEYKVGPETTNISFETVGDLEFKVLFKKKESELSVLSFDSGTTSASGEDPYSFSDTIDWIRRQLGAPQVTVELTNDQIYDSISQAVFWYNRYRNWNEGLQIEDPNMSPMDNIENLRKGHSEKEGDYYILPANINEDDVIDLFFSPKFASCWFGGDSFTTNIMSQTFFSQTSAITTTAADYYIWRGNCEAVSTILGTHISWKIYNHHIYITPNNAHYLDAFKVGIKYRQSLSIDEINNSYDIKELALGYSMITLGMIRGTYGNTGIPVGDLTIQLNSDTLITNGKEKVEAVINRMKSQQRPLMWIYS